MIKNFKINSYINSFKRVKKLVVAEEEKKIKILLQKINLLLLNAFKFKDIFDF